jgi:hypothetical protein
VTAQVPDRVGRRVGVLFAARFAVDAVLVRVLNSRPVHNLCPCLGNAKTTSRWCPSVHIRPNLAVTFHSSPGMTEGPFWQRRAAEGGPAEEEAAPSPSTSSTTVAHTRGRHSSAPSRSWWIQVAPLHEKKVQFDERPMMRRRTRRSTAMKTLLTCAASVSAVMLLLLHVACGKQKHTPTRPPPARRRRIESCARKPSLVTDDVPALA